MGWFPWIRGCLLVVGLATAVGVPSAQEYEATTSPFQGGFPYTIGEELHPGVEIDGVRWRLLRIVPKPGKQIVSGKVISTQVFLDFENTSSANVTVAVVILFEDAQGYSLGRVECEPERIPDGEVRELRQKFKIQGDVIRSTAKVYLFCEVER